MLWEQLLLELKFRKSHRSQQTALCEAYVASQKAFGCIIFYENVNLNELQYANVLNFQNKIPRSVG